LISVKDLIGLPLATHASTLTVLSGLPPWLLRIADCKKREEAISFYDLALFALARTSLSYYIVYQFITRKRK
jgi:hypothetical protein